MTEKEMGIVQKIGPAAFVVYNYVKKFPISRNMDIEVDLSLSDKTVISVLKKMQDRGIINRKMINHKTREIEILSEKDWEI